VGCCGFTEVLEVELEEEQPSILSRHGREQGREVHDPAMGVP